MQLQYRHVDRTTVSLSFLDQYWLSVLAVYLEAVASGVCDYYSVVLTNLDSAGSPEDSFRSEISDSVSLPDHVRIGPSLSGTHVR